MISLFCLQNELQVWETDTPDHDLNVQNKVVGKMLFEFGKSLFNLKSDACFSSGETQ